MGFERFLQWTTCTVCYAREIYDLLTYCFPQHNIRDVVPVPRHKGFVLY
jgi:hypothetical protein